MSSGPIPFDSILFRDLLSTPRMRAVWMEEKMVAAWMDVERAITEVQCELGMVPAWAAARIVESLQPQAIPLDRVRDHAARSGHLMVGFLRTFREVCGDAAEHFHLGPTTQDILDTGLTLKYLLRNLASRKPKTLEVVTLLQKEGKQQVPIDCKYIGFTVPDEFVVGYGLDYAERYRNLPYIGVLKPAIYAD